jgi:cyclopropane fatty-acyl-phospholipid synthase-like methyltransferase
LHEKTWLDHFRSLLPKQAKVLDLGCGSAQPIAQYLLKNQCTVTGVDSSEVLLKMAKQHFPEQTWILADMRNLVLDETFHGILAWDSFFHLTPAEQRKMFAVFQNHAQSGSALLFTTGPAAGEAIGDLCGAALYHASLAPEEYMQLLYQHGFKLIHSRIQDPDCTGHTVWLAEQL